ncbi:MAG: hypothetical protein CM1200mP16_02510 [Nitrospina sp.]|nr:MAG: hypothetical protein CM1200mP16_02510 [Nitrospina sp.]
MDLFLLEEYDCRRMAAGVSCGQDIAGDGCFSLGMISAFSTLKNFWTLVLSRLYWECGAFGQFFTSKQKSVVFAAPESDVFLMILYIIFLD